ncbi:Hypothetical predicted protein [Pelobates cultripes]|uniref:Uncharacterized protein n=1 Tax=Pelobates cultripes TaxID=61616 RepID=A0AAD1W667_PELCU|nr:Hypothetical predicted protein [Pelobates cultripes]
MAEPGPARAVLLDVDVCLNITCISPEGHCGRDVTSSHRGGRLSLSTIAFMLVATCPNYRGTRLFILCTACLTQSPTQLVTGYAMPRSHNIKLQLPPWIKYHQTVSQPGSDGRAYLESQIELGLTISWHRRVACELNL